MHAMKCLAHTEKISYALLLPLPPIGIAPVLAASPQHVEEFLPVGTQERFIGPDNVSVLVVTCDEVPTGVYNV